jgi:Na+/melibiose symporter-like transporter
LDSASAVQASDRKVPLPTVFAFGSLGMPLAALLFVFGIYLPRHYVSLGVSFLAVAGAITVVRVIDVVFDPVVALLMDRTRSPIGRYRPWLVLGTPIVMFGTYKLLMPSGPVDPGYLVLWLVFTYAGISMMTLGLAAWSALLAKSYNDRSRVYGWTQAMTVVGLMAILFLPVLTQGKIAAGLKASMPTLGLILIVAFPIALFICTVFTPEEPDKILAIDQRPKFVIGDYFRAVSRPSMLRLIFADLTLTLGQGALGPLYVYFWHDAKGFTIQSISLLTIAGMGSGILGAPFWVRMAQRFGKHRTLQIACVCYAVTQATLMFLPRVWPHYTFIQTVPSIILMFLVGFCASAFVLLVRAMVADVADEVRLEQNQDLTSLLFSMVTTTSKIGASIAVAIVFPVLAFVHYNGADGAVNTPGAIFGLEMCFFFAPVILVGVGGAMFFGYKLDSKRHAEIRQALDVAAAAEIFTGPLTEAPATAAAE